VPNFRTCSDGSALFGSLPAIRKVDKKSDKEADLGSYVET